MSEPCTLSEDTRMGTILWWETLSGKYKAHDLHTIDDMCYICEHGTYIIKHKLSKEEYRKLNAWY